ncbi:hypothetical protein NPIL_263801 [Nephila pilipes]|uniref:Uncharacterized protein n=1 Tax=Nephila pilipes TaxID=299642 RepID=A0A8X6UUN8_NEPPI|nr:hypothetical protein NPIL_263801 [Nephila pilipes]
MKLQSILVGRKGLKAGFNVSSSKPNKLNRKGLDGQGSREEQVKTEGSRGLTREESSKEEQWRDKRMMSEGSTESSNNHERQHQSKRRLPARRNGRKRSAPSSLVENTEMKRLPNGDCKWRKRQIPISLPSGPETRKMTRREAADKSGVLSRRSSPVPPRDTDRQVLPGRSSPYPLSNRLRISERQAATGRTSPYLTRAGGVETARSRSNFGPISDSTVKIVK